MSEMEPQDPEPGIEPKDDLSPEAFLVLAVWSIMLDELNKGEKLSRADISGEN